MKQAELITLTYNILKKGKIMITRDEAYELLKKYNQDEFHLHHGRMVEGAMRYFAKKLGYADEEEYWAIVGLLHDIDFEMWPEEHCVKAPQIQVQIKIQIKVQILSQNIKYQNQFKYHIIL